MLEPSAVLPSFRVLSAAKIARFVTAGEANIAVLSDVHAALQAAQGTLEDEKLGAMAEGLLRATRFETGVGKCDAESVAKVAAAVTADIEATIVLQDEGYGVDDAGEEDGESREQEGSEEGEGEKEEAPDAEREEGDEGAWYAVERLMMLSEKFKDKVHRR